MPRAARLIVPNTDYLVWNRSAMGQRVLNGYQEFRDFEWAARDFALGCGVTMTAILLQPDAVYFIARADAPGAISSWTQKILASHALRYQARHGGQGAVWQGRYSALPIAADFIGPTIRFLTGLQGKASAVPTPERPWFRSTHPPDDEAGGNVLGRFVAHCVAKQLPIGEPDWAAQLLPPRRPRGRPKKMMVTLETLSTTGGDAMHTI